MLTNYVSSTLFVICKFLRPRYRQMVSCTSEKHESSIRTIDPATFVLLPSACNPRPGMMKEKTLYGDVEMVTEPTSCSEDGQFFHFEQDPFANAFPAFSTNSPVSLPTFSANPPAFSFAEISGVSGHAFGFPPHSPISMSSFSGSSSPGTYSPTLSPQAPRAPPVSREDAVRRASEIEQQLMQINLLTRSLSQSLCLDDSAQMFSVAEERQYSHNGTPTRPLGRSQSESNDKNNKNDHRSKRQLKLQIRRQMKQQLKKGMRLSSLGEGASSLRRSSTEGSTLFQHQSMDFFTSQNLQCAPNVDISDFQRHSFSQLQAA